MPRYEYRCRACGDTFELNRPMAQAFARAGYRQFATRQWYEWTAP